MSRPIRPSRPFHPRPFELRAAEDLLLSRADLWRNAQQLSANYADHRAVTDAQLQAIGSALWDSLQIVPADFDAAVEEAKAAGAAILALSLHSDKAEVLALPWEALYHPKYGFLGQHLAFTFSRASPYAGAANSSRPLQPGPLRVLLFTSLPEDVDAETSRLNVEEEQAQVLEALLPWIAKGVVELEMPDDGQFSSLQKLLKEFQPQLLFLSGHGMFHHAPHEEQAAYGAFFFEDENGNAHEVGETELARALVGTGVQAVALSACDSAKTATNSATNSGRLMNGLAQSMSAQGIPFVIGMREALYDDVGIAFARSLCDNLARGERLDYALQTARREMQALPSGCEEGQWCLPILFASDARHALIDWDFDAQPPAEKLAVGYALGAVHLPERFIGRRSELRRYKNRLRSSKLKQLLITGPGGQGKTTLAGKLASDLHALDWQVFAYSARPGNRWQDFVFEKLQMALDNNASTQYDRFFARVSDEGKRAQYLYQLLQQQFGGKLLLFLDNLESQQEPRTHTLHDAALATWLDVAIASPGWQVLATSRWQLPGWPADAENSAHLTLSKANLGDFLQMAQRLAIPAKKLESHPLRKVYQVLGGNSRGLEFFAAALKEMPSVVEEQAFLTMLENTKAELQTNMAIEFIVRHLPANAYRLLQRLPNFAESVPREGVLKLGLDLPEPDAALQALLAVSLLEVSYEAHWQVLQYQCSPLVADWLQQRGEVDEAMAYLQTVADYQWYLFKHERNTLGQAIATHHALRRAQRDVEADRLTLDFIVGPMTRAGWYTTLLSDWLPRICESQHAASKAEALGQTGKLHHHLGNYDTALAFMQQALAIFQQIGDKKGEGITLNNISQIYATQGDYDTALSYLKQSLSIRQHIGDKAGEGATLNNIATLHHAQGDYGTALSYLKQSLSIRQQIGDKAGEGATLNNISQIYDAQGDYGTALNYLKESLSICQQVGDKAGEGATLNNISQIYQAQGDYETALSYLKQSLSIQQQIGDKAGEGITLNNISQIYKAQGDYETALSYLKQSLSILQQIGDKAGEGATLNNIATLHHARGDYDTALSYLKQSLVIRQQIGDTAGLCRSLINLGHLHAQNKQVQEAFSAWVSAYTIAKRINLAQALQALAELAQQLGMPPGLDGWEALAKKFPLSGEAHE